MNVNYEMSKPKESSIHSGYTGIPLHLFYLFLLFVSPFLLFVSSPLSCSSHSTDARITIAIVAALEKYGTFLADEVRLPTSPSIPPYSLFPLSPL